jgi:hypothetical protein
MSKPDISVVIPTHNRKEYLRQAIASCFEGNKAIDVEVVVVDDGSSDGTREWLRTLDQGQVRPIFQEHKGGQEARNRGLEEAEGKYVKFLDDDDWLKYGGLEAEYIVLEKSNADISYGAYEFVDSDGTVRGREEAPPVDDVISALLTSNLLTHLHRFTYQQTILEEITWKSQLPCRQDVDFILQAVIQDPEFVGLNRAVACLRQHEGESVSSKASQRNDVFPSRVHAIVLLNAIREMDRQNILDEQRREAAAEGLWIWGHMVAAYDLPLFREIYEEIRTQDPTFVPSRRHALFSILDTLVGPEGTEHLTYPFRKMRQALHMR